MTCDGCGNDLRLTTDTDPAMRALWEANDDLVCWGCVVRDVLRRVEKAKHTDEKESSTQPHYLEGRIFTAQQLAAPSQLPGGGDR